MRNDLAVHKTRWPVSTGPSRMPGTGPTYRATSCDEQREILADFLRRAAAVRAQWRDGQYHEWSSGEVSVLHDLLIAT